MLHSHSQTAKHVGEPDRQKYILLTLTVPECYLILPMNLFIGIEVTNICRMICRFFKRRSQVIINSRNNSMVKNGLPVTQHFKPYIHATQAWNAERINMSVHVGTKLNEIRS